jgi:hypothetical protein
LTDTPDRKSRNNTTDIALLREEIASLKRELAQARLRAANFEAAIRAALGAAEDGEPDPLEYLRYEFPDSFGGTHGA